MKFKDFIPFLLIASGAMVFILFFGLYKQPENVVAPGYVPANTVAAPIRNDFILNIDPTVTDSYKVFCISQDKGISKSIQMDNSQGEIALVGDHLSCSIQNYKDYGTIKVSISKQGKVLASTNVVGAYGVGVLAV